MSRRVEAAALLVAGHGAIGGTREAASAVHTLGQIGEALLATDEGWQIRRLSAAAGERYGADRVTIKQHVDELVAEPVRAIVLVVIGVIVDAGGPALVTSSQLRAYPEDATLPLAWIGERLRVAKAERVLVVVSGRRDAGFAATAGATVGTTPRAWLDALATNRGEHVIAVDAAEGGAPVVDSLLAGLCGDALDPRNGTVTLKSLSAHLARRVPTAAIQIADVSQTIASSPPLAGLWDVRRSQLAGARPRTAGSDDLAGTVLPGRFRIDEQIARGTFGTIYRAHQLAVERDVAVKVLHADIDPASEDGRLFVHEIRAVGRIDHGNVVRIYQADITHDGRLFYAMELLKGRDLQQIANEGRVPKERALDLMQQLLAGLGAAHDAGLVHADVKPANAIVVEKDGVERVVLVDFGLARLRQPDRPAESAGGTPAFMPPEQLHDGRVDARSDLFSAGLVLVMLLTGWRRPDALTLVPPLDEIADPELRAVLARALALEPGKRYQTAHEFASALGGQALASAEVSQPVLPFRLFAPLTEADRDRLHGREADIAELIEHVLYQRSVIYTAPSGTGKTSLLRAGLGPRLESLGVRVVYLRCRNGSAAALAGAISESTTLVAAAIAKHQAERGGKLVLVLDQLEAALGEGAPDDLVAQALGFARWPADADVAVVLSIREDYLARLVARTQQLEPGMPIVRLPPLDLEGARTAIVAPLAEARLAIEPELATVLLSDLQRAAAALAPEMGWGTTAAVYPPHLQLACSVLYEALGSGEATITLAHYRRLGGFDAIVGEHLERVLDIELAGGRDVIARDLFLALVTTAHERAMRPEAELLAIVGAKHGTESVATVLELLRARGLLVRVRGDGEPSWELVHDSLVPRVLAWIDRRDLARRRAIELVRYHLRRSSPGQPSLLGRSELRELREHDAAIVELDQEWRQRNPIGMSPALLVARSRRQVLRSALILGGILGTAVAITVFALVLQWREERERRRIQEADAIQRSLRDRDIGRFVLELEPFDWDPVGLRTVPVAPDVLPALHAELHDPDVADLDQPGMPLDASRVTRGKPVVTDDRRALVEHVEARAGRAYLVISGRGRAGERCAPSIVPVQALPGYAGRERAEQRLHIRVPTCQVTSANTIAIPAGPFIYGGRGDPPPIDLAEIGGLAERRVDLPAYFIDRTEVTNAAFSVFAELVSVTGIQAPEYPRESAVVSKASAQPDHPVGGITWAEARAYCRFIGQQLPTTEQWIRALRGGERLPDGTANPMPNRNLPWGAPVTPVPAKLMDTPPPGSVAVGSFPGDRSPDGVLDLAGNVMEWTDSLSPQESHGFRMTHGGSIGYTTAVDLPGYTQGNQRPIGVRDFSLGMRCAHGAE